MRNIKLLKILFILTISLLVLGCSSYVAGKPISQEQLKKFTKNVTTFEQVSRELGKPKSLNSIGEYYSASYTYTKVKTNIDPILFVPVVGSLFATHETNSETQNVQFLFDSKTDKLIDIKNNEDTTQTKSGFLGGATTNQ